MDLWTKFGHPPPACERDLKTYMAVVCFADVYDLDACMKMAKAANSEGFLIDETNEFRLPGNYEYYFNPDGEICQKLPEDRGPFGPRLILKLDLQREMAEVFADEFTNWMRNFEDDMQVRIDIDADVTLTPVS